METSSPSIRANPSRTCLEAEISITEAPLEKEILLGIADQLRLFNEGDRSE